MRIGRGDVALITGGGSGIGRAVSLDLARKGCALVVADLDGEAAQRCATEATQLSGTRTIAVPCDVRVDDDVEAAVQRAMDAFGRIDITVLNAGVGHYGEVEATSVDQLRDLFDINVLGVQRGLVRIAPVMRRQGRGAIVITGSVNGLIGWPHHGAYAATKFALTGLAQTLQMELQGSGVRCLLVLPANVQTNFYASATAPGGYAPHPMGRGTISAERVSRAVIRGIQRDAAEVYAAPGWVTAGARAGRMLPGFARRAGERWHSRTSGKPTR